MSGRAVPPTIICLLSGIKKDNFYPLVIFLSTFDKVCYFKLVGNQCNEWNKKIIMPSFIQKIKLW